MEIKPAIAYLNKTRQILENRGQDPELPIKSLSELNRKIWGLPCGRMTVIGSRTSHGKTAFIMQLMADLAEENIPILYLGFEMKPEELTERMFCNRYRVDNFELLTGNYHKYIDKWMEFCEFMKKIRIVYADGFGNDWKELNRFLDTLTTKPKVIIIDFIQAIARSSLQEKAFLDEYIRNFREMCVIQNFAGIVISQINRTNPDSKNKSPQLHQLKGTGFLEEHADLVLLLDWVHRSSGSKDKSEYHVNIAKNRSGRTGYIKIQYVPEYYLFEDWSEMEHKKRCGQKTDD